MKNRLILASGSPRRKELLEAVGMNFEVITSDADEASVKSEGTPVNIYVQELALLKASAVAKQLLKDKRAVIISADTVVSADGNILGKPKNAEDAFEMLSMLSGRVHEVYSGFCVMRISDGKTVCRAVKTDVYFKALSENEIWRYIATGEPSDKAGSYGIQGIGGLLVEKIDGDYQNVVGLSISALYDVLKNEFDIEIF